MTDRLYWVWLSCALGPATDKGSALLRRLKTPYAVFRAKPCELEGLPFLSDGEKRALCDKDLKPAQRILSVCDKTGIRLLPIDDKDYPERLINIYAAPLLLYIRGSLPDIDNEVMITVVGTRNMTPYGKVITRKFCMELAQAGAIVVSGLARGNDTEAAVGALKGNGKTVAVLGCGIDGCYPPENWRLLSEILEAKGAVISEYPPGTPPYASNFPQRNRILSGLSLGTLVVEAPEKSGSLITANLALEQGRDVFAVPGSILNPASVGTNRLIQQGAKPALRVEDILEEYECLYPHKIGLKKEAPARQESSDGRSYANIADSGADINDRPAGTAPQPLSPDEEKVAMALSSEPLHIDDIAMSAGLSARQASAALTLLELKGLAHKHPGGRFSGI